MFVPNMFFFKQLNRNIDILDFRAFCGFKLVFFCIFCLYLGLHFPLYANQVIIVIVLEFSAFLFNSDIIFFLGMFWGYMWDHFASCRLVSCPSDSGFDGGACCIR